QPRERPSSTRPSQSSSRPLHASAEGLHTTLHVSAGASRYARCPVQRLVARLHEPAKGSLEAAPGERCPKCRCGPLLEPLEADCPSTCPQLTRCPVPTRIEPSSMWQ